MNARINVSYLPDDRIVAAEVEGSLTIDVAHQTIIRMADASARHDTKLLLLDLRNASVEASTTDIYYLPSHFANLGLTQRHVQALVVAQDRQDYDFMETVSKNRGHLVKVFADKEKAKSWLKDSVASVRRGA